MILVVIVYKYLFKKDSSLSRYLKDFLIAFVFVNISLSISKILIDFTSIIIYLLADILDTDIISFLNDTTTYGSFAEVIDSQASSNYWLTLGMGLFFTLVTVSFIIIYPTFLYFQLSKIFLRP